MHHKITAATYWCSVPQINISSNDKVKSLCHRVIHWRGERHLGCGGIQYVPKLNLQSYRQDLQAISDFFVHLRELTVRPIGHYEPLKSIIFRVFHHQDPGRIQSEFLQGVVHTGRDLAQSPLLHGHSQFLQCYDTAPFSLLLLEPRGIWSSSKVRWPAPISASGQVKKNAQKRFCLCRDCFSKVVLNLIISFIKFRTISKT